MGIRRGMEGGRESVYVCLSSLAVKKRNTSGQVCWVSGVTF
jgi:hypothetical protein